MSFFSTVQNFEEIPNIDQFFQRTTFNSINNNFENEIFGDEFDSNKLFSFEPMRDSEIFFNNKEFSKEENSSSNAPLASTWDSNTHVTTSQESCEMPREVLGKRNISCFSDEEDVFLPASNEEEEEEFHQAPSKNVQNRMKNHPGSIAAKIRRLSQVNKKTGCESRIFNLATMHLTSQKREEFRSFTTRFHKTFKTWAALSKFLGSNSECGVIFVNMINLFLSEDFSDEYEEWLNQSQMNQETKIFLRTQVNKRYYNTKFSMLRDELLGVSSECPNAINKTKKFLKIM
jgi:hypothetical protein